MKKISQNQKNRNLIIEIFSDYLISANYKGLFGIAKFSAVFNDLMPIQKKKLESLLSSQLEDYMETGSIISIGICYPPEIIDVINVKKNGKVDKDLWNRYSDEYDNLNKMLKDISFDIAEKINGIAIPPTTETPAELVKNVIDYYPRTISHRVVAEHAGIGWRGKNELIITEKYGPAIRFTSILINIPLIQDQKIENKCGECTVCLDVCAILKNKNKLEDYRENCRKFLLSLGLRHDVCGKCVKACFRNGIPFS